MVDAIFGMNVNVMGAAMYGQSNQVDYVPSLELADFGGRAAAYIIDNLIVGALLLLLSVIVRGSNNVVTSFALYSMYQVYFLTQKNGQTPGKWLISIRVVKQSGDPLTVGEAFVRYLGYYLDAIALMIGFLWALWDEEHQCWHDKLVGTIVIRA